MEEKVNIKNLDSFISNMIEFATVGEVKRYLETILDKNRKLWRENLPDISELKPNKIKTFDVIIPIVYNKFMIIEVAHDCVIKSLKKVMREYLSDEDYNNSAKRENDRYQEEKVMLLKTLKNLKR